MTTQQRRCRDLGGMLSAYVDHEATAEEMAIVEAHARTCGGCAARLKRYQALAPRAGERKLLRNAGRTKRNKL